MSKPKTKADETADLLEESTVENWDGRLTRLASQWEQAYVIRQHLARQHGDTTPPPLPPMPPELKNKTETASASELRNSRGHPLTRPHIMKWERDGALEIAQRIISRHPQGVTIEVYRDEFERAEEARTERFDRSYLKALGTLKRTHHVINYKSRFFTYENLQKFRDDVVVGLVAEIVEEKKKVIGKWNVSILQFLQSRKGQWVKFADIVEHMTTLPDFEKNANLYTQTAVTLRKLIDTYGVIEKAEGKKGLYRAKPSDAAEKNAEHDVDIDLELGEPHARPN